MGHVAHVRTRSKLSDLFALCSAVGLWTLLAPQAAGGECTVEIDTRFVDACATGNNNGCAWAHAYTDLQDAIADAQTQNGDGDPNNDITQIWVAAGTYTPVTCGAPVGCVPPACTFTSNSSERSISFQLVDGVEIYGGFPNGGGTFGARNPDPVTNGTILSGDLNRDDVPITDLNACETAGGRMGPGTCDSLDANGARPTEQDDCEAIAQAIWYPGCCDTIDENNERPTTASTCETAGGKWYPPTCDIIAADQRDENVYHVLTADESVTSGTLDGFTITGGNAQTRKCYIETTLVCTPNLCVTDSDCMSGEACGQCCIGGDNDDDFCDEEDDCPDGACSAFPNNNGAGLFNDRGHLTIRNCRFTVNFAEFRGGGMMHLNLDAGQAPPTIPLTLNNVDFISNRVVNNGGGLYNGTNTSANVTDCNFVMNYSSLCGGGVCNRRTGGTWTNCKFLGNLADADSSTMGGGGMFNASSSPTLHDCAFFQNVADGGGGGGMWNETDPNAPTEPSSPIVEGIVSGSACNFTFNRNRSSLGGSRGGGAMWNEGGSSPKITNCTFRGNSAGDYGGTVFNRGSPSLNTRPVFRNCRFLGNSVSGLGGGSGGGIFDEAGNAASVVIDCVFVGNSGGRFGGGIDNHGGGTGGPTMEILNSVFVGNDAASGGGLHADAGVDVKVYNSLFVGNSATSAGGAIAERFNGLEVVNCTVVENEATSIAGNAECGGLWENNSCLDPCTDALVVRNSIFWGNRDPTGTGKLAQISEAGPAETIVVSHTDWQGHSGDPMKKIINEDPMFLILAEDQWSDQFSAEYFFEPFLTIFTDPAKSWTVDEFQDMILNPDTGQMMHRLVVSNTADTITVWGTPGTASEGGTFRITDYSTRSCALIDAGNDSAVPLDTYDVDGDLNFSEKLPDLAGNDRLVDDLSVPDDGANCVDLGAYEFSGTTDGVIKDTIDKNRFISFTAGNAGWQTAIRVKLVTVYDEIDTCSHDHTIDCSQDADCQAGTVCGSNCNPSATCDTTDGCPKRQPPLSDLAAFDGKVRWLGVPAEFDDNSLLMPKFIAAPLECTPYYRDWSPGALTAEFLSARSCSNDVTQPCMGDAECGPGNTCGVQVLHVFGAETVPCSKYDVQVIRECCPGPPFDASCFSSPVVQIDTALWGDVWSPFGSISHTDIGKVVDAFKSVAYIPGPPEDGAPPKVRAMLRHNVPPVSGTINFTDISKVVDGFKTIPYKEDGPNPDTCQSTVACDTLPGCGQCCDDNTLCANDADCIDCCGGVCDDGETPCYTDADCTVCCGGVCGGRPNSCGPQDSLCTAPASCARDAVGNDPIVCRDKCKRCN